MKCNEFQRELPEFLEVGGQEGQAHIDQCAGCSAVVSDLRMISQQARTLRDSNEPSPRVWNSIEIALRQEGLIRPQPTAASSGMSLHSLVKRWGRAAWLVPAAAAVLIGAFFVGSPGPRVLHTSSQIVPMSDDDRQVLSAVSQRSPMMTAAYTTNLQNVNEYIQDAQQTVDQNPNDEEARRSLMDAYEQKSMLYDLALDHSLQ